MKNKVIIGLILVTIGVFLLLANLGIINHDVFYNVLNLWPLLLIVIGINILFRNSRVVSYIAWGLFFIIIIIYGIYTQNNLETTELSTDTVVMERRSETRYANLDLDLGASRLSIDSTEDELLLGNLRGRRLNYNERYSNGKEKVDIDFESQSFNFTNLQEHDATYDFYLNSEIIWDLDFDLGALSGKLNFEDIPTRSIDLDTGAASLTIILGDKHDLDFSIDSGASTIDIIIPEDVGLRIEMDTGLSSDNIDELNLIYNGDYYISSNYDSAGTKINIDIDSGVGKINFSYK